MAEFGKRLERLRKDKGLNKKELSFMLGFTANVYGAYEREDRRPSIETLMFLANLYGVSLDYLISGKNYYIDDELNNYITIKNKIKTAGIDNPKLFEPEKWEKLTKNDIKEIESFFEWLHQRK